MEANTLFDDGARSLRARGSTLRVRAYGRGGSLTYKGPATFLRGVKTRREVETEVAEPVALGFVLASLGYEPVFRYEKKREIWRVGRAHVCLDDTPLGPYVEVEGARSEIERLAAKLRLPRPWIAESYPGLWAAAGRAGDMTFGRTRRPRRMPA